MHKKISLNAVNKLRIFLMISSLLSPPFSAHAYETQNLSLSKQCQLLTLSEVKGLEWVKKCTQQYPEILWLADAEVRKTEEGLATEQSSYSEQLFGQKFIEFDRTIMTLRCLQLILDGSESAYQEFTMDQPNGAKLSRTSFESLHAQGVDLIKSQYANMSELEILQAMEASLVLGDIGKSGKAREIFNPYGATAPDHDDFHEETMQILDCYPNLCPTFDKLSPLAKNLLVQTANLAHYGHVTHLEGGPGMFSKLKQSGLSSFAIAFDCFVHICDTAGALGHANNKSSLVYTEETYRAKQAVVSTCQILSNSKKTEVDAYNAYLKIRADWLGLNDQDRIDRALTRMGAMLRLFTPEDGMLLKKAILELDSELQIKILKQLDTKEGKDLERTPTYMPAVLVNLSNNFQLGITREERISKAVILGLPFLAKVLEKHKHALFENKTNSKNPLNFNKAAGIAKERPYALLNEFTIDQEGNVCID